MPTVVAWPARIAPNQVSNALTSALDVFPTFLSLAGIELPKYRNYDGIDLSDFFMGKTKAAHSVSDFQKNLLSCVYLVIGNIFEAKDLLIKLIKK